MIPMKESSFETKSKSANTPFSRRYRSVWTILIVIVIFSLCIRFWPRQQHVDILINFFSSEGNSQSSDTVSHASPLKFYSQDEPLVDLLENLTFKNYGLVKSSDKYTWHEIPCAYLEAQNVSGPYVSWADRMHANYLYRDVAGDLMHPPSGLRSSVPLGGISTGNIELRGDGTIHEWSIFNQYPAGAAKIQVIDDVFMGVRAVVQGQDPVSLVLQTHPSNQQLPAVEALNYHGSYPVSKLSVVDNRLPVDVTVYAYSRYKHNDMNQSATPAVAFTARIKNHLNESVTTSFMFNLPLGMEPHTQRLARQMSEKVSTNNPMNSQQSSSPLECFTNCSSNSSCKSWSYNNASKTCYMFDEVRLNGHDVNSFAGVKGSWTVSNNCITLNRDAVGSSANGNISLCPFSSDSKASFSFGADTNVYSLWKEFETKGVFAAPTEGGHYVTGAAAASVTLGPGETKEVTIVLGWYFPDRDFLGIPVGNFYANLFKDSVDAAQQFGSSLSTVVSEISNLHTPFLKSSLPTSLQDMLINSLSHVRSAFWLRDGRWRQWEAYDCVNMDSVHNDGERHIPYISIFPNSTISKLYAWAKYQLANGMIQEQLRCGCTSLPLTPQNVEFGCGRSMSDVSSMFIVYLLELLTWHDDPYSQQVVVDLYNASKKAAQWHIAESTANGIPSHLVDTYDVVGLAAYPHDAYTGGFHLLAMKAAEILAYKMKDTEFAEECHKAFVRGQQALDQLLWNETGRHYNAYTYNTADNSKDFHNPAPTRYFDLHDGEQVGANGTHEVATDPPGAIMTDTFYSQVLAYSIGLGTLVQNETRLKLHMKAELEHNDTPYGMIVLTGRQPYPGSSRDNAVWMMGNPNWATINMHLGEDVNQALAVGVKAIEHWRSVVHDQWNVVGVMGGLGYGADGLPYITSHYGYFMSSWHMVMAMSGQKANVTEKSLTFDPKIDPRKDSPFVLPIVFPGVWGYLQNDQYQTGTDLTVSYSIVLHFGSLELTRLSVTDCTHPDSFIKIVTDMPVSWNCSYPNS